MLRGAAQKEALGHGVGFLRRELWESGPFFSHGRHGLRGFALPCALAVMDFLGPGLKAHPVASWNLRTFSLSVDCIRCSLQRGKPMDTVAVIAQGQGRATHGATRGRASVKFYSSS